MGWFEDLDPFLDLFSLESVVTNLWYLNFFFFDKPREEIILETFGI